MANEDVLITPASEKIEFKQGDPQAVYGLITGDGTNFIVSGADDINISPGEDDKISFQYGGSGRLRFIPNDGASTDPFIIQGQGEYLGVGTEIQFRAYSSNVDTMRLTDSARVGIGTTTPAQKLYVSGGATTLDNGSGVSLYLKNAGSTYASFDAYGSGLSLASPADIFISGTSGINLMSADNKVYLIPTGTTGGDTVELKFREQSDGGSASINIKAPDAIGDENTWILPAVIGTADQVLSVASVASTEMTLDWADASGGGGTIGGSLSDNYIPIGTAADTIGNFVLGLTENDSIWIGSDPTSTTDTAEHNVALGKECLDLITTGDKNVAVGFQTLDASTTAHSNTAMGYQALSAATVGSENVAIGAYAGKAYVGTASSVYGGLSVFVGHTAGFQLTGNASYGSVCVVGHAAAYSATGANKITAVGNSALYYADGALNTTAVGRVAGAFAEGTGSTLVGDSAGYRPSGNYNVAVGYSALSGAAAGSDAYNNVAIGRDSMLDVTSGYGNAALGYSSLANITSGYSNIAIGNEAAYTMTTGKKNVAVGNQAGYSMSTGTGSVMVGEYAGGNNTANYTIGIGYQAIDANTTGADNVAIGYYALGANTTGNYNTAVGHEALVTNVDGDYNVGVGWKALYTLEPADGAGKNAALGAQALGLLTTGTGNIGIGYRAGYKVTTSANNIAIGNAAMEDAVGAGSTIAIGAASGYNPTGANNIFMGYASGYGDATTKGAANSIGIGKEALKNITDGSSNVAVGHQAAYSETTGGSNVYVGYQAGYGMVAENYNVGIGRGALYTDGPASAVALGYNAMYSSTGDNCTAIGVYANKTGTGDKTIAIGNSAGENWGGAASSVVIGYHAGYYNTGNYNVAIGEGALSGTSTNGGDSNVAIGRQALHNATSATDNVSVGNTSGYSLTTGTGNVMLGHQAGYDLTDGHQNVLIGEEAGENLVGGGYNVAIGSDSLKTSTAATYTIAIGKNAMSSGLITANQAIGIGYNALANATSSDETVAIGGYSGDAITTANYNTFVGYNSASQLTTSPNNTAVGHSAMLGHATQDTTSEKNVAIGMNAMYVASGANYNVAIGEGALSGSAAGMTGDQNVAVGRQALHNATSAASNTCIGYQTGYNITEGYNNEIIGAGAGGSLTSGDYNSIMGYQAGHSLTESRHNVFIGKTAGRTAGTSSTLNTFVGVAAGYSTTTSGNTYIGADAGYTGGGVYNTALGYKAGYNLTTGTGNVFIGYSAGANADHDDTSDKLVIANSNTATPLIGGDFSAGTVTIDGTIQTASIDDELRFGERDDLAVKGTSDYDISIVAPHDIAFSIDSDNDATTHAFLFKTNTKTPETAGTELMRIQEDGNVGIGTSAPNKTLEVIGAIHASSSTATDAIYYSNGQAMAYYGGASSPHMNFYSGDTDWRILANDGSVVLMTLQDGGGHTGRLALGSHTPAYKLDVVGTTQLSGNSIIDGTLTLKDGSANTILSVLETGTSSVLLSGADSAGIYFATQSGTRLELTGNNIIKTGQTIDNMLSYNDGAVHVATPAVGNYQIEAMATPEQAGVTYTTTLTLPDGAVGGERFTVSCMAIGNNRLGATILTGTVEISGTFIEGTNLVSPTVTMITGATAANTNVMQVKVFEFMWVQDSFNPSGIGGWTYTYNTL